MDGMLISMLLEKFPVLGVVGAHIVVLIGVVSILIQLAQVIVKLTPSPKDDEAVSKIEKAIAFIMPFLKAMPHMNPTPLVTKITDILKRLVRAVKAYSSDEEQK